VRRLGLRRRRDRFGGQPRPGRRRIGDKLLDGGREFVDAADQPVEAGPVVRGLG